MRKHYKNHELMKACGSEKGQHDPEAPDQWRWVLAHAESPVERAMAWVKSKTTAFQHDSPWCVDELGKPLYVQHLAADMGWAEQTARNVLSELQSQGRVKLKGKRIWYCADVPQAYDEPEEQPEEQPEKRRTIGERFNSVQSYFGAYVADSIRRLPEARQLQYLDQHEAWIPRKRAFCADVMAAARMAVIDPAEDSMLLGWGIPKKRLPKRRTAELKPEQLQLMQNFYSVQSMESPRTKSPDDSVDARAVVSATATSKEHAPSPTSSGVSSSSKLEAQRRPAVSGQGSKSAPPAASAAYETPRDELIAIYKAKTGELPPYRLLDRIETLLLKAGSNFDSFLEVLKPHLGNEWRNPPAFLTHKAKFGFDEAVPVSEPKLKLAPKCPQCLARGGRGAILEAGAIVPCPDCSTPEWIKELAGKLKPRSAAGGAA